MLTLVLGSFVKSMKMRNFFFGLDCVEENIIWWKAINRERERERENASINYVIRWKTIAFKGIFLTTRSLINLWCKKCVNL